MEPVRVDAMDLRILRELFCGEESFSAERLPLDEIARRLEVHRNTVSARVKRLTHEGVFLPPSLDVEPGKFGLVAALVFLDVPRERRTEELKAAVFAHEEVQALFHLHEGWVVIVFGASDQDVHRLAETLRAKSGATRIAFDILSSRDYPPAQLAELSALDARLVEALLADARAAFPDVAAKAGVTATTVKRRFERLLDSGTLFFMPGRSAPVEGVSMGYLIVDVPDAATESAVKARVVKAIPDHFIRNLAPKGRAHFFLFAQSVEALERMARVARDVPGVAGVELRILAGLSTNPAHKPWIAQRVRARVVGAAGDAT